MRLKPHPSDKDSRRAVWILGCPVFDRPFHKRKGGRVRKYSATLDRIRPKLGYVKGNICVISYRANLLKSNASVKELKAVIKYLKGVL